MKHSKILLIDDEDMVRQAIARILQNQGFEVEEAANGEQGLRRMTEFDADLVITDIVMPKKEGIETIIELRKRWPQRKIIAISGISRKSDFDCLKIAEKFGADGTLAKPFTTSQIVDTIDRVLSRPTAAKTDILRFCDPMKC